MKKKTGYHHRSIGVCVVDAVNLKSPLDSTYQNKIKNAGCSIHFSVSSFSFTYRLMYSNHVWDGYIHSGQYDDDKCMEHGFKLNRALRAQFNLLD